MGPAQVIIKGLCCLRKGRLYRAKIDAEAGKNTIILCVYPAEFRVCKPVTCRFKCPLPTRCLGTSPGLVSSCRLVTMTMKATDNPVTS